MIPSRRHPRTLRSQRGVINLGGIGVVLCLVFVFYCALGKQGEQRYSRICSPFSVTSNLFTSIAALLYDGSEVRVKEIFDNITYGCKYTVWRLNNEKEWQAYVDEMKKQGKPIPGVHQPDYSPAGQQPVPGQARTIAGTSENAAAAGSPTKPAKPAIDVKGAVEGIEVPSLPPFPGSSKKEQPQQEAGG